MTYLLYFRNDDPNASFNEYIILTPDIPADHPRFRRIGFSLFKTVEILEDLYEMPLDRELVER